MRYGHSEGHTDVCFDDTGKYVNMKILKVFTHEQKQQGPLSQFYKQIIFHKFLAVFVVTNLSKMISC